MTNKVYLGDAVYADCDGYAIILTTDNGIVMNEIVLEPQVWVALLRYVDNLAKQSKEPKP